MPFFKRNWTPIEWEGEVFRLLSLRPLNRGVQRVPSNYKGDWGVDFFCLKSGEIFQCYSPEEPTAERFRKQRDKITRDIAKLVRNDVELVKLGGRRWVHRWVLAVPVFDDKRLLLHASEKQNMVLRSGGEAIASDFAIFVASHQDLEREVGSPVGSEFDAKEIIEGLREVLYRSEHFRSRHKVENALRKSGLQHYLEERQVRRRNERLALCMSAISKCLLSGDILPVKRFLELLREEESGEVGRALELVLRSKLFIAGKSIRKGLEGPNQAEATFAFPKPRAFFGRDLLLSELVDAILKNRLVTVYGGIGGLGKTTLACQAAAVLYEGQLFPDGIIFVDLEEAASAQSALLSICKGLRFGTVMTIEEVIRNLGQRRALLIIDNIETVLARDRMEFRKIISKLLEYSRVNLLCTGRESINLPDEKLVRPKPLERQEAAALLEHHLKLRLGLQPEGGRPRSFEAALDICDGIPLAIELVASWLPGHSLDAYVAEFLRIRAGVLRNPSLERGDRLTNYVISTHLTYQLLPAYAQELLRYVSMLPAAPKLTMLPLPSEGSQALAVRELENRSLVSWDYAHLKVLIPVREAIRPLVGEVEIVRLASFILMKAPRGAQDLEAFVLEQHSNLTWAIVNVLVSSQSIEPVGFTELVMDLESSYIRAGLLSESKEILDNLLDRLKELRRPVPFRLHCFRGNIERLLDNYKASEDCYSEALAIVLSGVERARILIGQGNVQKQIQKYPEAEVSFREALDISLSVGAEPALRGECLWGLANVEFATSRWDQAKSSYVQALNAFEQAPPSPETIRGIIDCQKGLCDIYLKKRSLVDAEAAITAAHAMFYDPYFEFRNRFTEAKIQQGLGDVKRLVFVAKNGAGEVSGQEYAIAEEAYKKAITIYHEMKAPIGEALSYYKLGELYVFAPSGEEQARGCFLTAAAIFDHCGNHLGRAKASLALLKLEIIAHGAKHRFLERAHELLGVFRDICRSLYWQAEAHLTIAACRRRDDNQGIVGDLAEASRLFTALGRNDKLGIVESVRKGAFGIAEAFWE